MPPRPLPFHWILPSWNHSSLPPAHTPCSLCYCTPGNLGADRFNLQWKLYPVHLFKNKLKIFYMWCFAYMSVCPSHTCLGLRACAGWSFVNLAQTETTERKEPLLKNYSIRLACGHVGGVVVVEFLDWWLMKDVPPSMDGTNPRQGFLGCTGEKAMGSEQVNNITPGFLLWAPALTSFSDGLWLTS